MLSVTLFTVIAFTDLNCVRVKRVEGLISQPSLNGNSFLFANSDKQNALSPEFKYPETNDNTYKKPLNPFNGKQFRGGLEGFKKELLNILNSDEMVSYMKQSTSNERKRQDELQTRKVAQDAKFYATRK